MYIVDIDVRLQYPMMYLERTFTMNLISVLNNIFAKKYIIHRLQITKPPN